MVNSAEDISREDRKLKTARHLFISSLVRQKERSLRMEWMSELFSESRGMRDAFLCEEPDSRSRMDSEIRGSCLKVIYDLQCKMPRESIQ
jgi:hypothetical protein